jgi:nucleoid-associated protein YgaU
MSNLVSGLESDVSNLEDGGQLEHAYLLILPGSPKTAAVAAAGLGVEELTGGSGSSNTAESSLSGQAGSRITFLFNPLSYTIEKSAEWARYSQPGQAQTALPIFKGSGPRTMNVEVLLDSTATSGSVQADVDLLFACCKPTLPSMLLQEPSPPLVMFGWGSTLGFLACMRSVRVEYSLFMPNGTPLRATCSLTMEEIPISLPGQNPTSGGTARRTRTVIAGDTLQSIAFREYGRPGLWRAIAELNGIDDPTRVPAGSSLLIPPLAEAAAVG